LSEVVAEPEEKKMMSGTYVASGLVGPVDKIAEYIRVLNSYAPASLTRYAELTIIQDQTKIPRAELMFVETQQDIEKMIELVVAMFDVATQERQQGIANYMAELQDFYGKKAWMVRSILKKERE
jgi:DNA-binding ferritin-like protein